MNNPIAVSRPVSLPVYDVRPSAQQPRDYLLVTQKQGVELHADLQQQIAKARSLTHLTLPEQGDMKTLQRALAEHLRISHVGVQLHVQGDESFLWKVRALAVDAGLLADEISLSLNSGPGGSRSVFCVHCARVQDATDAALHTCCQCAVVLEVRQHFSQRLGAYIGVCADADLPYGDACA
jgi:hypothetical protein